MKVIGSSVLIGKIDGIEYRTHMYQCEICAKTIMVSQKDLSWI
jgi:hypothetical protein